MSSFIDIAGQRFGRLTVVACAGRTKRGNTIWTCRCDCGNEKIVQACICAPDRPHPAAACARRATSTAGGRKSSPNPPSSARSPAPSCWFDQRFTAAL
jgi:hypothetical protein